MSFRRLCIKNEKKWQTQVEEIKEDSSLSDQESSIPIDATTPKLEKYSHNNPLFKSESTYRESESDEGPQKTVEILIKESKIINHLVFPEVQEQERDHLAQDFIINATEDIDEEEIEHKEIEYAPIVLHSSKVYSNICKPNHETAIYICELCGTHARSKVSFERHIRKHTGERPFACEYVFHLRDVHIFAFITILDQLEYPITFDRVCTARFLSAGELRAHGFTHTGERPFPCRFCDRRYISYMGRLKHERMHTNERPFVCAECGKAFTSADILRNHMLVHTGERLFRQVIDDIVVVY